MKLGEMLRMRHPIPKDPEQCKSQRRLIGERGDRWAESAEMGAIEALDAVMYNADAGPGPDRPATGEG